MWLITFLLITTSVFCAHLQSSGLGNSSQATDDISILTQSDNSIVDVSLKRKPSESQETSAEKRRKIDFSLVKPKSNKRIVAEQLRRLELAYSLDDFEAMRVIFVDEAFDPDSAVHYGLPLLHVAVDSNRFKLVNFLLNDLGFSIHSLTCIKGLLTPLLAMTNSVEMSKLLISNGAVVNGRVFSSNFCRSFPIINQIVKNDLIHVLTVLLQEGADISILDSNSRNVLQFAVRHGSTEAVSIIKAHAEAHCIVLIPKTIEGEDITEK